MKIKIILLKKAEKWYCKINSGESFVHCDLNKACRERDCSKVDTYGHFAAVLFYTNRRDKM